VSERLANKTAIVVGAGQTEGETIGNGRATAILFAPRGRSVLLVDRDEDRSPRRRR
jgi:NAD(P)-dependent dehydrogenase (short-subunit alcohol dehydrogenase family)